MASRIQIGKTVKVGNQSFKIGKSTREGKKYKACPTNGGSCVHFGATGYTAKPGTTKGDSYCARSAGIKSSRVSANTFARMLWNCEGKKSKKK
jgi:hypothetical protein